MRHIVIRKSIVIIFFLQQKFVQVFNTEDDLTSVQYRG